MQRWVGGAGEELSDDGRSVSWTHFEQCGGKLTPRGHRIDGAMAYGREVGRWRLVDQIMPVAEETEDAVSDHVAMVYSIQLRLAFEAVASWRWSSARDPAGVVGRVGFRRYDSYTVT